MFLVTGIKYLLMKCGYSEYQAGCILPWVLFLIAAAILYGYVAIKYDNFDEEEGEEE